MAVERTRPAITVRRFNTFRVIASSIHFVVVLRSISRRPTGGIGEFHSGSPGQGTAMLTGKMQPDRIAPFDGEVWPRNGPDLIPRRQLDEVVSVRAEIDLAQHRSSGPI